MDPNSALSARISEALARGDALAALRLMRQAGTRGLKDALVTAQAQDQPGHAQSADAIQAIRRLRAANPGMSLRDAKLAVDALRRQGGGREAGSGAGMTHSAAADALSLRARNERTPTVQEGDHGGYAAVLLAVAAALGALAWWWLG